MKKMYLIGNAHLDPVWMWQWQEGFAEIKATFKSALDRMKEYDDFKFTSACSAYYMWIEKSDKRMFDEIVERVKEGRWSIVGGQLIQPDCNIPCGESFARHGLISQRYFKEKFGIIARTGYNVDSFGHNGNLPKILNNLRMDSYVFMRPMPNEKNIPESLFKWESMDGSSVTAYRIPLAYGIDMSKFEMFEEIDNMETDYPLMAFYGVGNHGGGPTKELLDKIKSELDGRYIMSTTDEYFDAVSDYPLITVRDDLQFHAKGCYSAYSRIKADNRRSENSLLDAEVFSVLSNRLAGTEYPTDELDFAWKNVLFNQFHDILGGCSIREAYDDAEKAHGEALNRADRVSGFALQQISWSINTEKPSPRGEEMLGTPVVVFNPLPFEVTTEVKIRKLPLSVTDENGTDVNIQKVRDSKTDGGVQHATAFSVKLPPLGYRTYKLYFTAKPEKEAENPFICTDNSVENSLVRVSADPLTGELNEIFLKDKGINILAGNTSTVLVDELRYDTWAHDVAEFKDVVGVFTEGSVHVIENGPVRATLRCIGKLNNNTVMRDYTIEENSAVVRVKARVDFHEKHKMLKFRFPINASDKKAYAKIPFGYIERPTDGSEQVCGDWFAFGDGNGSGAVIATTSKHSFSADDSLLTLTVVRGAIFADHYGFDVRDEFCDHMDQGEQNFEYSISPFVSFAQAEKDSLILNHKPSVVPETFHSGALPESASALSVSKDNIIVTAVKKHEDSDSYLLRCYEAENKDTAVKLKLFETEWESEFSHNEVKTFIVSNGGVKECDFTEWDD